MRKPKQSDLPPSGAHIRITYLPGFSGQQEAVYHAALREGILISNCGRSNLSFVRWEIIAELRPLEGSGRSGTTWGR